MKNENKLQRLFDFEVRAENNEEYGDYVTGRAIVYDSVTDIGPFNEVIEKGALDNTDLRDVRFLVNHNTDMIPLARSRRNNVNSTMQMSVDDEGMVVRVNLDTENNSDARNLYSAIKRGDVSGMSFMFGIDAEAWDDLESEHPTRHIQSISKVFEVSAVTFPAYEDTSISARSADVEALENAKAALESVKAEERAQEMKQARDMLSMKLKLLEV